MLTNTLYFATLLNNQVTILSKLCSEFGITHAVICPGSRSAPLVFAFNRNKNFKTYTIIDERSAAYIALGIAQQLQKPVALICTSGTAAVNFYPAIAEAFYQKIPLVVLTADRPLEMINQQDGQMINQINLFGSHVRASMQFSVQSSQLEVQNVLEKSTNPVLGPVHINVPLIEPLYENLIPEIELIQLETNKEKSVEFDTTKLSDAVVKSKKKIILVGQLLPNRALNKVLIALQEKGFIILADVVSNQHENIWLKQFDLIIAQATKDTLQELEPDLIISLGGPVLSKALKLWLKQQQPSFHFRIQQDETLVNTYNNVTDYIFSSNILVLNSINNLSLATDSSYSELWYKIEQKSNALTKHFTISNTAVFNELVAVDTVLDNLPSNSQLHIANSTSIRYVSYLGVPQKQLTVFCNRGTSGIDGCSSTTIGAALANNNITTLVTGDLALFYDRNAFWNNYVPKNLRIILLNNSGGGIFNLIDGPSGTPELEQFFLTKHHLKAKNLATDFGLIYENCTSQDELNNALKTFFEPSDTAKIIELSFDMEASAEVYKVFRKMNIDHS
ncbi:MAG: 2-succinyl-5-enolpyruvyl-6-hydroxy-3-cyclohexene-1-carboxylic-acid synthase [Bacteroidota bacterium]